MKKCPYCGRENDDDIEICLYCYAGFPEKDNETELKDEQEEKPARTSRRKK